MHTNRPTKQLQTMKLLVYCANLLIILRLSPSTADHHPVGEADCSDIMAQTFGGPRPPSGKYHLMIGEGKRGVWAYCDMETAGGGWTVFQKRSGLAVNFYRTWKEYSEGFGDPDGDYWLGNTYLHSLTVNKRYVLRVDLTDWENKTYYAEFDKFIVGGEGCMYPLESLGDFCGNCGNSLSFQLGMKFTTFDSDNDIYSGNCAQLYRGAWWYQKCHASNLNGEYKIGGNQTAYAQGLIWFSGKGSYYSYMISEMKIRPYKY